MYKVKSDNFTVNSLICARRNPTVLIPTLLACFGNLIVRETLKQKADPKVPPNTSLTQNGKQNRAEIVPAAPASNFSLSLDCLFEVISDQDRRRDRS